MRNIIYYITLFSVVLACPHLSAQNTKEKNDSILQALLPEPQSVTVYHEEKGIAPDEIKGFHLVKKAQIPFGIKQFPLKTVDEQQHCIVLELNKSIKAEEGYELAIKDNVIRLSARTSKGLLYGMMTLEQIARNAKEINAEMPALKIEDYPHSSYRAIHLDLKHHIDKKEYMYSILDKMLCTSLMRSS